MSDRKCLLTDLRVIDLRAELEKRNLDKSGVRGVLIQRLSKHLEDEGHDPATYRFDLSSDSKKTPSKKTRRSESKVEAEDDETPAMEDMIVQDDAGDDDEPETAPEAQENSEDATTEAPTTNTMEVDPGDKKNRKRENDQEPEVTEPPKKPCLDKEMEKHENNIDTEDSINLDIGDDELLNEETDTAIKDKKDAGNEDSSEAARDEAAPDSSATASESTTGDQQVNTEAAAPSNDDEKTDDEQKDGEKKDKKDEGKEGGARNLWVSGLSGDTRAKDLKQLCSKHGKVIGAKVVTNARTPGSRCYGYVTMASAQDAENCIKNLHRTELHGRMISVEKAKSESESASRRQPSRNDRRSSKDDSKENDETKDDKKPKKESEEGDRATSRTREKSHRSDKDRPRRSTRSRERKRSPKDVLSFSKIWQQKERDVYRARERSRLAREEDRRRRAAEEALRERERRQRQEKHRLELEREKLRAEREKIEREKNELLRLERERHRLEREKLELERLELKRAQLRLEEERRKRTYEGGAAYRKGASPPPEPYDRHKRPAPPLASGRGQFEAPPPPRFEMSSSYDRSTDKRDRERDYKRDYPPRHVSSANMKYPSNGASNDDARQPIPPGTRPKEPSRSYESRDTRPYRPSPPGKPEPRGWNATSRYPDAAAPKGGSGSGEQWSGGAGDSRYGTGGGAYETRYQPAYQPPPPGAAYPDRYPAREYRKY